MVQPVALISALALSGGLRVNQATDSLRLIVATGTVCHSLPDPGSPIAGRYHFGDVIGASKSTKGLGGALWYFDSWRVMGISPTCWVRANETVPFDRDHPDAGFAAVVDRVLARDSASFETLVEAENYLIEPNHYANVGATPLASSGLLQFKRLLLIERAAKLVDAHAVEESPLRRAWVLAHSDYLYFFEPDAMWFIANTKFWALFDANRAAPWAEQLAAFAAQRVPPSDECGADCFLWKISEGPQQYWTRLPNGRSIEKALTLAIQLADYAIQAIDEEAPTRRAIDGVRASLAHVDASGKQALLDRLARLDRAVKP